MNWIVLHEKREILFLLQKEGKISASSKGSYITIDMTIGVDDDEKRKN